MIRFPKGPAIAATVVMICAASAGDTEEQLRALFKAGRIEEGLARIETGLKDQEARPDPATAYWEMWSLARLHAPGIPAERRYDWMRRTYARLLQCPADDARWTTSHRINAVQMACEIETDATTLGLYGEAFLALQQAETHARALWDGEPRPDRMRGRIPVMIGVTVALFLDRASHLERQGRIDDADAAFRLGCEAAALVPSSPGQARRALNNRATFLTRIGRSLESEALLDQAARTAREPDDSRHPEVNRLRRRADTEGPSDGIIDGLLAHASRFRAEGRVADALGVLRQCATLRFFQGRHAEAWPLFAEVEKEAARLKLREAATDCAYWRAKARSEAGLLDEAEADFLAALSLYREAGMKPAEEKLYNAYAMHLDRRGLLPEALDAIRESIRLNRMMHLPYLLPGRLAVLARLLAKAGRPEEAEAAWQEALAVMDTLDQLEPARRLTLLVQRLEFLQNAGRNDAMTALLAEARTLADEAGLSSYARRGLDGFDPARGTENAATAIDPGAPVRGIPDLQPRYVATRCLPGERPRAWFWLLNPGSSATGGSLSVSGRGTMTVDALAEVVAANARLKAPDTAASTPVHVGAGAVVPVRVEADGVPRTPARIFLAWPGAEAVTSVWEVVSDADTLGSRATVHASLALWNPFFAVPVYHEIGRSLPAARTENLRLRASTPCRVEIYDATLNRLVGVDRTGDGSFLGVGDVLASDADADGTPDVTPGTPVWVYLFPSPGIDYRGVLDLAVEVRDGTGWKVTGHDRVVGFGAPATAAAAPAPPGPAPRP